MLNSIRTKSINSEQEAKFIQDRINLVEKNVAEFCCAFSTYSRKAAKLRDEGDEIAKVALAYAESEDLNKSLSNGLASFANSIAMISDYGNVRVQSIDNKIVDELSQYENICKHTKDEIKQIFSARSKEISKKRHLDRARERNPRNRQQIIQAETELVKASSEVAKTMHNLEEQVISFEAQKLHDIKVILLDFISTEMGYHAKCLELLTKCFQDINRINEESDLEEFKKSLRVPETTRYVRTKRSLFRTSQSLGSLSTIFSTPKKKLLGIPQQITKHSRKTCRSEEILDAGRDESTESDEKLSESEDAPNTKGSKTEENSPFTSKRYVH